MPFIQVQQTTLTFNMRRSLRAKRLQMLVREQQFEIVAPLKVKNREILAFVKQYQKWMLKQKQKRVTRPSPPYCPQAFLAGERLFFRGNNLLLNIKFGNKFQIKWHEAWLTLTVPSHQIKSDHLADYAKRQVMIWYQQEALKALEAAIVHFCPLLGRWPAGYNVKRQKTRWGSCGTTQKIHINWLLMLAPVGIFEYVVVHELCHLFHRNHGKRFWAKVASLLPDYKIHERWLSKNGHLLQI